MLLPVENLVLKEETLKVKGLPNDLPEFLPIDITNLKIHDAVKVGDLSYDKIELLDPKKSMVLTIATSRVAQKVKKKLLLKLLLKLQMLLLMQPLLLLLKKNNHHVLTIIRLDEISDSWPGKYR